MRPETVKSIQNLWNHCSIAQQKALIHQYLAQNGRSETGKWLRHLAEEFGLDGYKITPVQPANPEEQGRVA